MCELFIYIILRAIRIAGKEIKRDKVFGDSSCALVDACCTDIG